MGPRLRHSGSEKGPEKVFIYGMLSTTTRLRLSTQRRDDNSLVYQVLTLLQNSLRSVVSALRRLTTRIRLPVWPDSTSTSGDDHHFPGHTIPTVTVTDEIIELTPISPTEPTPSSSLSILQDLPLHTLNESLHLRDVPDYKSKKSHSVILPLSRAASRSHCSARAASYNESPIYHSNPFFKFNRSRNPTPPSSISSTPPLTPGPLTPTTPAHASGFFSHLRPNRIPSGGSTRTTASSILGIGPIPPGISCASSLANLCASLEMQVMSNQVGLEDWRGRVAREAETTLE